MHNRTVSCSFSFLCSGRPKPDPTYNVTNTSFPRLGGNAEFEMRAVANPAPAFAWTFKSEKLNHTDTNFTTILKISNVDVDKFGYYQLTMSNVFGNNTFEYQLIPRGICFYLLLLSMKLSTMLFISTNVLSFLCDNKF